MPSLRTIFCRIIFFFGVISSFPSALAQDIFTNVRDIAIDAGGNFWVRKSDDIQGGERQNYRVVKLNSSRAFVDSVRFQDAGDMGFESMTFDPSGNLWIESTAVDGDTSVYFKLYKVSAAGAPILDSVTYQSSSKVFDVASGLVSDAQGRIWSAGTIISVLDGNFDSGTMGKIGLWKFSNSGQLAAGYPKLFDRGFGLDGVIGDQATGIDTAGNIYGAALSRNGSGTYDFCLWKWDSSGSVVSGFPKSLPVFHTALNQVEMSLVANGSNVWITGTKLEPSRFDFYLLKYDLSGNLLVSKTWRTSNSVSARGGRALAVAPNGDVVALGDTSSNENYSARALWRYTSSGALVAGYPRLFNMNVMAMDGSGNIWTDSSDGTPVISSLGATIAGMEGAITKVSSNPSFPTDFTLSQNYPNPFNPSTSFTYTLGSRVHVLAEIYDVLGRLANVLVDQVQGPGVYHATWNAETNMTGTYFLRLRAGTNVSVRKLILLR